MAVGQGSEREGEPEHAQGWQAGAGTEGGSAHIDLLRHMVNRTKTAVDKADPNGQGTRLVTAVCRQLLEYRQQRLKWSTQPVPPGHV